MTSYDQIWTTFLNNCKASDIDLPSTTEKIYENIKNAVSHFNNRMRLDVKCNDTNEQVDRELSEDQILIIAHYIRLVFLINQKTYFESVWQPFSKDVGIKNVSTQLNSIKSSVEDEKNTIERLIMYTEVDYL